MKYPFWSGALAPSPVELHTANLQALNLLVQNGKLHPNPTSAVKLVHLRVFIYLRIGEICKHCVIFSSDKTKDWWAESDCPSFCGISGVFLRRITFYVHKIFQKDLYQWKDNLTNFLFINISFSWKLNRTDCIGLTYSVFLVVLNSLVALRKIKCHRIQNYFYVQGLSNMN